MTQHTHVFIPGESQTIAVCACGAFRHMNLRPEDVITEQKAPAQRYPSIKAIQRAFGQQLRQGQATEIRRIMEGPTKVEGLTRMEQIDKILETHGVERIPPGRNAKSPAILYCNAGDPYAVTIMKIRGRFRIGCWGDIVERGNYD